MSDLQDIIASSSVRAFNAGHRTGYQEGSSATDKMLRELVIQNLMTDGVLSTNLDVELLERVVEIVEES
jgi:hypothetical protein